MKENTKMQMNFEETDPYYDIWRQFIAKANEEWDRNDSFHIRMLLTLEPSLERFIDDNIWHFQLNGDEECFPNTHSRVAALISMILKDVFDANTATNVIYGWFDKELTVEQEKSLTAVAIGNLITIYLNNLDACFSRESIYTSMVYFMYNAVAEAINDSYHIFYRQAAKEVFDNTYLLWQTFINRVISAEKRKDESLQSVSNYSIYMMKYLHTKLAKEISLDYDYLSYAELQCLSEWKAAHFIAIALESLADNEIVSKMMSIATYELPVCDMIKKDYESLIDLVYDQVQKLSGYKLLKELCDRLAKEDVAADEEE